jgi:putative hydroxymethylpyrimidine transporter CytX
LHLFFLWFGAAVSVAEILTGGLLVGLGPVRGMAANVAGHLVGCGLLVLGGLVGYRERLPAIRSMRLSFGRQGSWLLSLVNVMQLIGWTAVMVLLGGRALSGLGGRLLGLEGQAVCSALIGVLVGLWVVLGVRRVKWLNTVSAALLFGLTVVLTVSLLGRELPGAATGQAGSMTGPADFSFGFELALIMPLSWFPLISDYTSLATSRTAAWLASFAGYFLGSTWMYGIGLYGTLATGTSDPAAMMVAAQMGVLALAVIGLSTVTTTFLDVWSAAESARNVFSALPRRAAALVLAAAGTVLGMFFPMERYEWFLYILGSVFAPIVAILLADAFVLGVDRRGQRGDLGASLSLAAGIAFYYLVRPLDPFTGPTLATLCATFVIHYVIRLALPGRTGGRA